MIEGLPCIAVFCFLHFEGVGSSCLFSLVAQL